MEAAPCDPRKTQKLLVDLVVHVVSHIEEVDSQGEVQGRMGLEFYLFLLHKGHVALVGFLWDDVLLDPRAERNRACDSVLQLRENPEVFLMEVPADALDCLLLQFPLGPLGDLIGASLERSFRLPSIVLGLDMRVKRRVREIPLPAPALEISAFLIFPGPTGGGLLELVVRNFILHDLYFYTVD